MTEERRLKKIVYLRDYRVRNKIRLNEWARNKRKSKLEQEKTSVQRRKWRKNNREAALAHLAVQFALRRGRLVKPKRCEDCNAEVPLQGHHPNYKERLNVIWLCAACHKKAHRREL